MNGSESALLWVSLVGIGAAGFLGGYLAAVILERHEWLPIVEAAAARPVHVIVEAPGAMSPADTLDQADDDTPEPANKRRVPTPTFYG